MTGVRGRETGDLDVVAHQVFGRGEGTDLALEIRLLGVPARAPAQDAADVKVFSKDVPHHGFGADAFRRAFVVAAAGGVDVVVAGEPVPLREVRPALQDERL